jgi:hypothetical protein
MKNHDVVPTELVSAISGLRSGAVKVLGNLVRHKLISHEGSQYDGYRLTYPGYDFLALRTLLQKGVLSAVGRQIGMGKESDIFLGSSAEGDIYAIKLQRLGRVSFRAVKRTRDYLAGRRSVGWLYMSRLATLKEFAFMQVRSQGRRGCRAAASAQARARSLSLLASLLRVLSFSVSAPPPLPLLFYLSLSLPTRPCTTVASQCPRPLPTTGTCWS